MASVPPPPKAKFSVYQNPSLSAALTANSLRPSSSDLLFLFLASLASFSAIFAVFTLVDWLPTFANFSSSASYFATRVLQVLATLAFVATVSALGKAWARQNVRRELGAKRAHEKESALNKRQLGLLGLKPKQEEAVSSPTKPPKSPRAPSESLVLVRKSSLGHSPARSSSRIPTVQQFLSSSGKFGMSPVSPSLNFDKGVRAGVSPMSLASTHVVSPGTPWSKSSRKAIMTEEMLEQFLADVDEKIVESAEQAAATPSSNVRGFGIASPGSVGSSVAASGAARSTPLRPVRGSPGSHQKYGTPPKKAEGDSPVPMSMEETIMGFESLGIYQIDKWRDRLRQWFSSGLLGPLVEKIETSHLQVMQLAARLGISITVNKVGTDSLVAPVPVNVSPIDGTKEWQPTSTLDEDWLLHQLRSYLVQVRDASAAQVHQAGANLPQQTNLIPVMQACINAITEHQRLNALMKGELVKGLLPQSSVHADYTVRRVQELAEGTCVKYFDYVANGQVFDKLNKKWTSELPSDSHLLGYLFCCFLDHPKWILHVEPTYYSTQSIKNPLFLGCLPPKDRFPEKYVAVISGVPSVIHPGACILVIGKQSPPTFNLYWDNKLQFSLQGRSALWDAILLLCYRIKEGFGGVVRGLHLGSAAFDILPILELEEYD